MLSLEDNAVRVSTIALLTLSALAVQNSLQQANANPVAESLPEQPPSTNDTNQDSTIVTTYAEASLPESIPDRQFAPTELPTELPPSSPAANRAITPPSVTAPEIVPIAAPSPTLGGEQASQSTPQDLVAEAIDIPVTPFPSADPGADDRPKATTPTNPAPIIPIVEIQPRSQGTLTNDRSQSSPNGRSQRSELPAVTVSQRSRALPNFYTPGIRQRRVSVNQLRTVRVTNRTRQPILIELVGRTSPLRLNPGQTRSLRANPQDLSLLYWHPNTHAEFDARVSQPDRRVLVVDLFPSRFPIGSLGIYLPEPVNRPDIVRIF